MRQLFSLILLLAAQCAALAAETPLPYALADTEVRDLRANTLQRDYQLYVSLPKSYATGERSYPVVYVTDAPYAFPVTRAIAARVTGHSKQLPEFIVVGLSYAKGDTPEFSRRRDYTPSAHGVKEAISDMPGRAPAFGEAEAYRRFLAEQVLPYVAAHYRIDPHRKIFAGHSYGSLLGAHVLLSAPEMFDGYILGSPSLWYDQRLMFARERSFAASHKDLAARVYLGAGAFEGKAPKKTPHDPRYATDGDMVADTEEFARALGSHRYPNLHVRTDIIAGEDHLTVAPILMTHGLLWTLGSGAAQR